MTVFEQAEQSPTPARSASQSWQARLELGFEMQDFEVQAARTILRHRKHIGPLRVQKALWPEDNGICHAILVHPPAGIAGGDALEIDVQAGAHSHAVLTTIGAGKWYGSDGRLAEQSVHLRVGEQAVLEWLPQEVMLYDSARVNSHVRIDLAQSSCLMAWDMLLIGRASRDEYFTDGLYNSQTQIWQGEQLLLDDRLAIAGGDRWLTSPLGLAGHRLMGTFWAVAPDTHRSAQQMDALIDQMYELIVRSKIPMAITRLDHLLVMRYVGDDARQCLDGFAAMRASLRRAWLDLDEAYLRIWRT
jgi:urease accessory protein